MILGVSTRKHDHGENTIAGTQLRGSFVRKEGNSQSGGDGGRENHREFFLHGWHGKRNGLGLGRRSGGVNGAETHQHVHRVRGIPAVVERSVLLLLCGGVEVHYRIVSVEAERRAIVLLRRLFSRGIRPQIVLLPLVLDLRIPPAFALGIGNTTTRLFVDTAIPLTALVAALLVSTPTFAGTPLSLLFLIRASHGQQQVNSFILFSYGVFMVFRRFLL